MFRIPGLSDTCILASVLALAVSVPLDSTHARGFTVLYTFQGSPDGDLPEAGLIMDQQGNLYGTTEAGGDEDCPGDGTGCGIVFKLAPDGTETVLHSFTGGSDGIYPEADLIMDEEGNLYGTTFTGGSSGCSGWGCGTVFAVAPDSAETVLYTFTGGADGAYPYAGLVTDNSGNLYGTTYQGGGTGCSDGQGCGTVFELAPDGTETRLHAFQDGTGDGQYPKGGVVRDRHGNLYGTTYLGGSLDGGTIFKLASDGTETILHSFCTYINECPDGQFPDAGLIRDAKGNLYGTTYQGGADGDGTVFKLAPDGTETVFYSFKGGSGDGSFPTDDLVRDDRGNLYGTTEYGGRGCDYGCGTVFKVAPDGTEKVMYFFTCGSDGAAPVANLIAGQDDNLYGTAAEACGTGYGTVFALKK